jgi:hypothetical protein
MRTEKITLTPLNFAILARAEEVDGWELAQASSERGLGDTGQHPCNRGI